MIMEQGSVLRLDGVEAAYGPSRVLHGVTLEARDGEVVSLLGRNGAGKSTTLKAIVGLVGVTAAPSASTGAITAAHSRDQPARRRLGPEDRRIFSDLTVAENLLVGAKGGSGWSVTRVFDYFPSSGRWRGVAEAASPEASKQMLTGGAHAHGESRVFSSSTSLGGVAPVIVQALGQQIAALKREG